MSLQSAADAEGLPLALQNIASATTTRASYQRMVQSNNNSSDPSARFDNVQKQMQTTAQLELFKGQVANSFDLGRSGDKTHQQSAVPMTGK